MQNSYNAISHDPNTLAMLLASNVRSAWKEVVTLDTLGRLSANLTKLMEDRKVTVIELAEYCDVSRSLVYSWRKGEVWPSHMNVDKLCEFFMVPPQFLFADPDRPHHGRQGEEQFYEILKTLAEAIQEDPNWLTRRLRKKKK